MHCRIRHHASSSDNSPTLPAIEPLAPLGTFLELFQLHGDATVDFAEPQPYVVVEAVQDPGSTDMPEAVPVAEHVLKEAPEPSEGEHPASKSSTSSSSQSDTTTRPVAASPPTIVLPLAPDVHEHTDATTRRKSATFVVELPGEECSDNPPAVKRQPTTIKIIVEPGDEDQSVSRKSSVQGPNPAPSQPRSILKSGTAENGSVTSKQSKRSRLRSWWQRLIAKFMLKRVV